MFTIYAVYPADYQLEEQAVALFAHRTDAQFFVDASHHSDREYSAPLIIQEWQVSNVDFMAALD